MWGGYTLTPLLGSYTLEDYFMNSENKVWEALEQVRDPEIPSVSIIEMGMVQQVEVKAERVRVILMPTFSGCPALNLIKDQVASTLRSAGFENVEVQMDPTIAWSTDRILSGAFDKMKRLGISPPPKHAGHFERIIDASVLCPYCGSEDTIEKNDFGPTLCRAIYYCNHCQQPFERFKPI
jgi:ring-1,2-phenylacetyl-CoA epoxidase subunit PaaD